VRLDAGIASRLKRDANGLFAAVAQERGTGKVLMVAWMDDVALARTLETRKATYFSRSRQQHWVKGETSGHTQYVHSVRRATPAITPASMLTCCWVRRAKLHGHAVASKAPSMQKFRASMLDHLRTDLDAEATASSSRATLGPPGV
jgi:phosphoribosyl-AMP cyclohydrolase